MAAQDTDDAAWGGPANMSAWEALMWRAEAVGQAVVDLEQVAGPTVFEALDEHDLPRRARLVQRPRQDPSSQVEQLAQGAWPGQPHPLEVVVEVEVRIG